MDEVVRFLHGTVVFVSTHWEVLWIVFLLLLIVVSHLLILRRCRIMDDRIKELVAHQRDVETWMESVRNAVVGGIRR